MSVGQVRLGKIKRATSNIKKQIFDLSSSDADFAAQARAAASRLDAVAAHLRQIAEERT